MKSKVRPNDNNTKKIKEHILNRDVFGRTVLHVAVLCDLPELMSQVLRIPEAKLIILATDCENGWNILHFILYHKRFRCLAVLLLYFDKTHIGNTSTLHELLKKKDRSGTPPLFLLRNDVKDFVWIPTYVNEHNEYHLEYRYPERDNDDKSTQRMRRTWQLDHIMWSLKRGASDLYVMGSNVNHSLGVGDSTDRSVPVKLSHRAFQAPHSDLQLFLRRPRYRDFRTSKYHSVALTTDGRLFTCGLASNGRLGVGTSKNSFIFTNVKAFEDEGKSVSQIAVSTGHNLALTSTDDLYAWGLNAYSQLGFDSTELNLSRRNGVRDFENVPLLVTTGELRKKSSPFIGIAASKIHSVAYTENTIYMWGLNVGQMGLEHHGGTVHSLNIKNTIFKGSVLELPKSVPFKERIRLVTTCETCTCVVTESNDLFVFYQCHRYKLPKLPTRSDFDSFDLYKPSRLTISPVIRKVSMKSPENIFILLESGDVMSFAVSGNLDMKSARNIKFSYIWRAFDSNLRAVDIDNSYDGSIVLCTRDGSVFLKSTMSNQSQRRPSNSKIPSLAMTSKSKFRRLDGVNRVVKVCCDELFISFGFMRDECDMLPFKLQKNDFRVDMEYLSHISEADSYRKQDQLLDTDHDMNCYVSDFIYPARPRQLNDETPFLNKFQDYNDDGLDMIRVSDKLYQGFVLNYEFKSRKPLSLEDVYQACNRDDAIRYTDLLSSEAECESFIKVQGSQNKFHDATIRFRSKPHISLGIHLNIIACRSKFFHRLLRQESDDEYFITEGIEGNYDVKKRILTFTSDVDVRAVLILLHCIYTNRVLSFWDSFPSGAKCPPAVKRSKDQFTDLMTAFQLDSYYGKENQYIALFQNIINNDTGDLEICLRDGEMRCDSSILSARSAFFETFLSERWENLVLDLESASDDETKHIDLQGISLLQFEVIVRHIYGCNDLHVFDSIYKSVAADDDSDDFVNFLLDLIEISDELLLIQLKHICELAIKDLIAIDNVLLLLEHSYYLNASKLFKSCCWCIFNNLDILVFESSFQNLDEEVLIALEKENRFLQLMKQNDFVIGAHGEVNLNLIKSSNGPVIDVDTVTEFGKAFNDIFLTDDLAFKPIFDHAPETLGTEEKKRRSSSRRLLRRGSTAELNKELQSLNLNNNSRKISDSAIADDVVGEEGEFETVSSRRRRKSKAASIPAPEPSDSEPTEDITLTTSKPEERSSPPQAAKPVLGWDSHNSSTSSIASVSLAPVLGEGSSQSTKSKVKVKFSASKPSQKQRKKLGDVPTERKAIDTEPAPILKNPWRSVSPATPPQSAVGNMPVLGSSGPEASSSRSMTAIMLEESMKIEINREAECQRKSLQEIQQEQEFAKWWEEESRRVQQEMRGPKPSNSGNSHKNNRARKPRDGKKRIPL